MNEDMYRKLRSVMAVAWAAAILAGCTPVGPMYQPPDQAMPAQWQQGDTMISPAAGRTRPSWWSLFGDPLLDSLVDRAAASNQDLRAAEARIREARAERVIATASGSLSSSLAATRSRRSENGSSSGGTEDLFQAGFDAGWELDVFGGVRRAGEAADASLAASESDLRDILISLQAEVVRNYLELRGNQMRLAAAGENIALQQKTVELAQGRFEMGLASELELVQARTQLALTRAQVPAMQTSVRQAMHQLAILLDQTPESLVAELSTGEAVPPVPPKLPVNLPSDLLRQRPDIRSAERRLAAATADIGVATAELFPRFSLSALLGLESSALGDLISSGSRYWSAGPTLQLTLFDQGKTRAGIEVQKAQRDEALAVYRKTVLLALAEVEDSLTALSHEQETRDTLAEAVESGTKAVTIAKGLYGAGLVDFLNVLTSQLALYQSRDRLIQSEQQLDLNMVALFKAMGGGWTNEHTDQMTIHPSGGAAIAGQKATAGTGKK